MGLPSWRILSSFTPSSLEILMIKEIKQIKIIIMVLNENRLIETLEGLFHFKFV